MPNIKTVRTAKHFPLSVLHTTTVFTAVRCLSNCEEYFYCNVCVSSGELHNEELNDLHSSPNIVRVIKSRRMRWAGHVARLGERRGIHRVLVGKPEGKRPLGPRFRWKDNIKMDLQELRCGGMDWFDLAQDRDR